MNRAMLLPAAIAAGLHIAVLAYRSAPSSVSSTAADVLADTDTWILPITPEEPPPVNLDPNAELPVEPPPVPVIPQGAELLALESHADFPIERPPAPKVEITGIDRIDPNWQPNSEGKGGPGVPWVLITELDNVPRALFRHAPTRPPGTGTDQETVIVEFMVGKDGNVAQVRLVDSTRSSLDDVCLRAVKRWRFEPGMRRNVPVAFRMQQTFVFTTHD